MQLELPHAITPDLAVDRLTQRLERYVKDIRNFACVNAEVTITKYPSYDTETKTVHPGDFKFSDDHCKNQRRNGSKFCQACSDKHHEKETESTTT